MDADAWLRKFVREHQAVAGIVYERGDSGLLLMAAAYQLPPLVVAGARVISRGQGLAGLAFERNAALSTCTGRKRLTRFASLSPLPETSAVALPVHDKRGDVRALVYLVFPESKRLRDDELVFMLDRASTFNLGQTSLPQPWPQDAETSGLFGAV